MIRRSLRYLPKDLGGLALAWPGQALVAALPRERLEPLANALGDLRRQAEGRGRLLREELVALFGERPLPDDPDRIVRDAYRLAAWNDLEVLRYPALGPQNLSEVCTIEGREHLDAALAAGRGALILIGHFGANQMIMPALGHLGYPMNQLSAPPTVWADLLRDSRTTPLWERVLERRWALEQRLPVRHINVFKFLRPAFQCLQNNEVLGLAFDGGGGTDWTSVRLLARTANIAVQPAQLWRKTGATLLPAVVLRRPGEPRHRVVIGAPVVWRPGRDRAEATRTNLQAVVDWFSVWVAAEPAHYLPFIAMRRRNRGRDLRPFFEGWPPPEQGLDPAAAEASLRAAGARTAR